MISGRATLIILAIVAVWAYFYSSGINSKSIFLFTFMSVLYGASYYFGSRKSSEPTKTEKTAAMIWLLIRRLVCFLGAIFFLGATIFLLFFSSETLFNRVWLSLVLFVTSVFCIWVGIYGQGWQRGAWKDDVALHKHNKERYKWPW